MTQPAIEALLRQKTGLDVAVFAGDTLAKAVQFRMAEQGILEIADYLNQLHISVRELGTLVEAVIVPETWFFRDKEPFVLLQNYVKNKWAPIHPNRVLRILSLPCSTGEEPYSIAIALIEAGLSADQFQIDAIDISRRSLQIAQRAIYDKHSFRGTDLAFQQRYFTRTTAVPPAGYCLCDTVRQSVHFQHGNIVDFTFAIDKLPYDIIFCRNLMIYFDNLSREHTLQVLDRLLNSQGLLFVGHAETALLPVTRFIPIRHPFAFAHVKVDRSRHTRSSIHREQSSTHTAPQRSIGTAKVKFDSDSGQSQVNKPQANRSQIDQPQTNRSQVNRSQVKREPENREYPTEPQKQDLLSTAKLLANQGCLQEAVQQCQEYLNQHRTNAEAYVLLGQVYQAMGQELQAEQCFQKALYLNPKHLEALVHLALLLEQQGNVSSATTLRQRIQRLI